MLTENGRMIEMSPNFREWEGTASGLTEEDVL